MTPRFHGISPRSTGRARRARGTRASRSRSARPGEAPPTLVRPGHVWSRAEVLEWLTTRAAATIPWSASISRPVLPFVDAGGFFPVGTRALGTRARSGHWSTGSARTTPISRASSFVDHPERAPLFPAPWRTQGRLASARRRGRLRARSSTRSGEQGSRPYSCLNLIGAAQVGKSSLTGMRPAPHAGRALPIWPFDPVPAAGSLLVEIYTSLAALAAGRQGQSHQDDAIDSAGRRA